MDLHASSDLKPRPSIRPARTLTIVNVVASLAVGIISLLSPAETQNAVANGDTRTIQLYHAHTKETITATFLVNGSYDQSVLDKLNWFLRDWRRDEPTKMDARLFDVIWEVYRESGSRQPIEVMSAYRSPETNAMLRRRSRGVAEHSQHILGKAMDQHYYDVPMSKIREMAMRLQRGGVGFYPTAGTPFVHMDVGGVRHWPRMSYDQLSRLFPDGKTVHIPSNGQPLSGYEEARAELEARGDQSYPTASQIKSKGFFAWLFGGGGDEDEDGATESRPAPTRGRGQQVASLDRRQAPTPADPYQTQSKNAGTWSFLTSQSAANATSASAPRPAPQPAAAPTPRPVPQPAPDPTAEAKLALAMSMQQQDAHLQAEQDAPLTQPQPVATVSPVPNLAVSSEAMMASGLSAPMPPRRPVDLASLDPDQPLPPRRPQELTRPLESPAPTPLVASRLAKADGISVLLNGTGARPGSGLPSVITQGTSHALSSQVPTVLGYSGVGTQPANVPLPVNRPADLVYARLDRSNFRSLTSAVKTARIATPSGLGSPVVGVRAASRARLGAFAASELPGMSFGARASDLATDRFSGPAIKPQTPLVTAKRAEPQTQARD